MWSKRRRGWRWGARERGVREGGGGCCRKSSGKMRLVSSVYMSR